LGKGPLYLNQPGRRAAIDALPVSGGGVVERKSETDLEKALLFSSAFKCHFGLEKSDRQFPVGLFRDAVKQPNRIFPGGKGAIDLVGIGDNALWLFELKAGGNIPAGILSELLFYTTVVRDTVGESARFQFEWRGSWGSKISRDDIRNCRRIEAVLLAEQLHPLIGHSKVLECLNEAAVQNWNARQDHVPVTFHAKILKRPAIGDDDYGFVEI
jgi:hypothetical protein